MYPVPFDYHRPSTIGEALELLEHEGATLLAGGHSLLPALKRRAAECSLVVDVSAVADLQGIDIDHDDGVMTIGAAMTYSDLLTSPLVREHLPLLTDALEEIGDRQIRNRGTIGGNLVQADLGADLPAVGLAMDAKLVLAGPEGTRTLDIDDLYTAENARSVRGHPAPNALADEEIVTAINVPLRAGAGAYQRKTHPATGYALVGIAAHVHVASRGTIDEIRLGATGLTRRPIRLRPVERDLTNGSIDDATLKKAADVVQSQLEETPIATDPNVSAAYRRMMAGQYTKSTIAEAVERTQGKDLA